MDKGPKVCISCLYPYTITCILAAPPICMYGVVFIHAGTPSAFNIVIDCSSATSVSIGWTQVDSNRINWLSLYYHCSSNETYRVRSFFLSQTLPPLPPLYPPPLAPFPPSLPSFSSLHSSSLSLLPLPSSSLPSPLLFSSLSPPPLPPLPSLLLSSPLPIVHYNVSVAECVNFLSAHACTLKQ